jgi:hypothetical protein
VEQFIKIINKFNKINTTSNNERIPEKLYKYDRFNYPELTEDLYVTGDHSILVIILKI